ncbi:hypothetical protein B0H34DRAFT_695857 [Crassisporium funariophilum]|nr:hypothetical protein B0H34DRAFT_695857 [Crassisporium funariophilum]
MACHVISLSVAQAAAAAEQGTTDSLEPIHPTFLSSPSALPHSATAPAPPSPRATQTNPRRTQRRTTPIASTTSNSNSISDADPFFSANPGPVLGVQLRGALRSNRRLRLVLVWEAVRGLVRELDGRMRLRLL